MGLYFAAHGDSSLDIVAGNDVFPVVQVEKVVESTAHEGVHIVHFPSRFMVVAIHISRSTTYEAAHLQEAGRPQIRMTLTDGSHCVGECNRMSEIQPADVVADRSVCPILQRNIVVQ